MTGARLAGIVAVIVALAFGVSLWLERQPPAPSVELAVAAKVDTIRVQQAAQKETVYVAAKASGVKARASFAAVRDSALANVRDTALVIRALAKADTAIVHDTVTIAAADTALAAQQSVTAAVRNELAIALRPHPAKRLTLDLTGLYDPIGAAPLAMAAAGVRVIGSLSLQAVVMQRVSIGESPHVYVGVSVAF